MIPTSAGSGMSPAAVPADIARAAPWLLRQVSRRYRARVAAALRAATLGSLPQSGAWVLVALASGRRDASELVGTIGVTKQAVSKVLDALVAAGYVARSANPADRRRTDLSLTDEGQRAVATLRTAVQAADRAFATEVGESAWRTTIETLGTLARLEGDEP